MNPIESVVEDEVTLARKAGIKSAINDLLEFQKLAIEKYPELLVRIEDKVELIAETYSKPR